MNTLTKLEKALARVEKELDKCRTSTIDDGWQTQRFARKSRRWDYYAREKMKLKQLIEDEKTILENSVLQTAV